MDRKAEVQKQGKHKLDEGFLAAEREFFRTYNENMTPEQAKERYAGIYGTDKGEVLPKKKLEKIWRRFLLEERIDYITQNNTMSVSQIVEVGIDKFVRTNGWDSPADVPRWRSNVVRIGTCPSCKDQFIPLIMQANHGLCKICRPSFSGKAIKRFVEHTISTNERYAYAHKDALMDFYIMFHNDTTFRNLFKKDSDSAKEFETREFEIPEWFLEAQEKEVEYAQQKMLEMFPEEGSTNE